MNKVNQIITDKIIEQLQVGKIPWKKAWAGGEAPKNIISKKNYRGVNALILGFSEFKSPYWMTFNQATQLKGIIKKGSKSTKVIFWQLTNYNTPDQAPDEQQEKTGLLLKYYNVFNLEQVDGIEAPNKSTHEFTPIEEAEKIVNSFTDKPEIEHIGNEACYLGSTDTLRMPNKNDFFSDEEYYSILFHELIHSTGVKKRLGRFEAEGYNHTFGSEDYSKEELIAEMGASFLCAMSGITQPVIKNQAAYIKNWLRALENDVSLVISAGGKAQKAVDWITNTRPEQS